MPAASQRRVVEVVEGAGCAKLCRTAGVEGVSELVEIVAGLAEAPPKRGGG